uniref:Neprosin PEP catalytic domain-containing protein n=1 Tax=Oryza meridionalis TaxID=40149 RepID=A0A0E0DWR6_9ORYZ
MKPERSMKEIVARSGIAARTSPPDMARTRELPGVPIRRPLANVDPLAAERVRRAFSFGYPYRNYSKISPTPYDWAGVNGVQEVAAAYGTNGPYHGLRALITNWPQLDYVHPNEFSMNYIMIGYTLDKDLLYGRAWPAVFGDSRARLFVYYTNDSGNNNNCFNLDCGGFHLQNSSVYLGGKWDQLTQPGGARYALPVSIHRDDTSLAWWVSVLDMEIGYYPENLFDTEFPDGSYVEMGGRVADTRPDGSHTATQMGNGSPACGGSRFATTILEYFGVSAYGELFRDSVDRTVVTTPSCYGAQTLGFSKTRPGYSLAYGGSGGIYCDVTDAY